MGKGLREACVGCVCGWNRDCMSEVFLQILSMHMFLFINIKTHIFGECFSHALLNLCGLVSMTIPFGLLRYIISYSCCAPQDHLGTCIHSLTRYSVIQMTQDFLAGSICEQKGFTFWIETTLGLLCFALDVYLTILCFCDSSWVMTVKHYNGFAILCDWLGTYLKRKNNYKAVFLLIYTIFRLRIHFLFIHSWAVVTTRFISFCNILYTVFCKTFSLLCAS